MGSESEVRSMTCDVGSCSAGALGEELKKALNDNWCGAGFARFLFDEGDMEGWTRLDICVVTVATKSRNMFKFNVMSDWRTSFTDCQI